MFSELTIFAVDRFWRSAKIWQQAALMEPALVALLNNSGSNSSKTWAALLLHSTLLEPAQSEELVSALIDWKTGAYPPSSLTQRLGFIRHGSVTTDFSDLADHPAIDSRKVLSALQASSLLNHQSIAEIVLAVAGNKMSRIAAHSALMADIAAVVEFPFFVSSQSIKHITDSTLDGFSNRSAPAERINDLTGDFDVNAYFGGDLADQALLSVLDQLDSAGRYFGIPSCCRAYFAASWGAACGDHDGDMAFQLLSSQPQWTQGRSIHIPWQCNPYGMYFGGGLTWHFPCSLSCAATIAIANERFRRLSEIDATFARECRGFQERPFMLLPDRTTTAKIEASLGVQIRPFVPSKTRSGAPFVGADT